MITSGHSCAHTGCTGHAVFGFTFRGATEWACRAHRARIGFTDRPAAASAGGGQAGPQAADVPPPPAAAPSRAATHTAPQGSLL